MIKLRFLKAIPLSTSMLMWGFPSFSKRLIRLLRAGSLFTKTSTLSSMRVLARFSMNSITDGSVKALNVSSVHLA